ncbi:uncharacterized protein LOC141657100 [Silene latifolia]|uniref:uncharacterized protein LOC141657100 n=1 Tax=Silene latifolia TaxID=37657 RepID=UPI003D772CAB
MDSNGENVNNKPLISSLKPERKEFEESMSSKEDSVVESQRLLRPRNGGISKDVSKTRRKVQWNDINGNKLAEVVEFQVSDGSDSDDDSDSCFCTIM